MPGSAVKRLVLFWCVLPMSSGGGSFHTAPSFMAAVEGDGANTCASEHGATERSTPQPAVYQQEAEVPEGEDDPAALVRAFIAAAYVCFEMFGEPHHGSGKAMAVAIARDIARAAPTDPIARRLVDAVRRCEKAELYRMLRMEDPRLNLSQDQGRG